MVITLINVNSNINGIYATDVLVALYLDCKSLSNPTWEPNLQSSVCLCSHQINVPISAPEISIPFYPSSIFQITVMNEIPEAD